MLGMEFHLAVFHSVERATANTDLGSKFDAYGIEQLTGETVVRTGSRGMLWLEPLVEVETSLGRVGYGPVTPADVAVPRGFVVEVVATGLTFPTGVAIDAAGRVDGTESGYLR